MTTATNIDPNTLDHVHEVVRGAWSATIIDRNGPHRNHGVADSIRYMVRLNHPNGFNTEWPLQYDNGAIAYDMYAPPRDAKRAAEAAYRWIRNRIAN